MIAPGRSVSAADLGPLLVAGLLEHRKHSSSSPSDVNELQWRNPPSTLRGKLSPVDLFEIALRDAGAVHPTPFLTGLRQLGDLRHLDDDQLAVWTSEAERLHRDDELAAAARELAQATPFDLDKLPTVLPGQRVLLLPGSAAVPAFELSRRGAVHWADVIVVACQDEIELTVAGLFAVLSGVASTAPLQREGRLLIDPELKAITEHTGRFDWILGRPSDLDGTALAGLLAPGGELVSG